MTRPTGGASRGTPDPEEASRLEYSVEGRGERTYGMRRRVGARSHLDAHAHALENTAA